MLHVLPCKQEHNAFCASTYTRYNTKRTVIVPLLSVCVHIHLLEKRRTLIEPKKHEQKMDLVERNTNTNS